MKRVLSAVVLSGAVALVGAAGAQATTYPAPPPGVSVSNGTVAPGKPFTFTGKGFAPGETIRIIASKQGVAASNGAAGGAGRAGTSVGAVIVPAEETTLTAVAGADGSFSIPIALNDTGVFSLTATGLSSGKTESTVVTVVPAQGAAAPAGNAAASSSDNLASTGANGSGLVLWSAVGLGALALGAGSVVAVRRKAAAETAA